MKVGFHAGEEFDAILDRKRREIEEVGYSLWGYGGSACHPTTQVQELASIATDRGEDVAVLFIPTPSRPILSQTSATEYRSSPDEQWRALPDGLSVTGSKFALVLGCLEELSAPLELNHFEVAVGPSRGRPLGRYLRGRVDKACAKATRLPGPDRIETATCAAATLRPPYAVFLR